ncbi:hypothetical protein [Bacillus suaedaesalsae]|uniref:DUF1700 domain-containing protein n=1 Tax=Bacillus suaedaesalsae TaxID=2810349 RepID=A0ABS2DNV6_9BACI|nr:hypothetical protein [Bacillus suaedaesalsae]MBM6619271.1 hypothetical protein [Bacillus suaedaesalsae]
MNDIRKQIIIKEIEYWKRNRLLPEQYCNYLLTLYSEGEHETSERNIKQFEKLRVMSPIILLFLLPALFLFIYFNELSFGLQIVLQSAIVFFAVLLALYHSKRKNQLYFTFYTILTLLLFFIVTIDIIEALFRGVPFLIEGTVLIHCALWYGVGKRSNIRLLEISGIIGIVFLIASILYKLFNS